MHETLLALPHRVEGTALPPAVEAGLLAAFFARLKPSTVAGYRRDLQDFARWLSVDSIDAAAELVVSAGPGPANAMLLGYIEAMRERGLAVATINRRLAAVRSLVRCARLVGRITWTVDVPGLKAQPYRDTHGPGADAVRALLAWADGRRDTPRERRDAALLHLLCALALRRGEVCSLDMGHAELDADRLWVLGKGRDEREWQTVPQITKAALARWLDVHPHRDDEAAPLFCVLTPRFLGRRLTGTAAYRIVVRSAPPRGAGGPRLAARFEARGDHHRPRRDGRRRPHRATVLPPRVPRHRHRLRRPARGRRGRGR